ncbi:hypothetical protein ZHAS_00013052 [Anopheles sinensis]|uniref:Uncharacterized protein n=1 Tax=Anopheles sinensis TaxID=74873 RepID=A0A084W4I9_ANOSI|nr:hypothetical protein ZHAS_00013052 [Anopheles sinensis]
MRQKKRSERSERSERSPSPARRPRDEGLTFCVAIAAPPTWQARRPGPRSCNGEKFPKRQHPRQHRPAAVKEQQETLRACCGSGDKGREGTRRRHQILGHPSARDRQKYGNKSDGEEKIKEI